MLIFVICSIEWEPQSAWDSFKEAVQVARKMHFTDGNFILEMELNSGESGFRYPRRDWE